MKILVSTMVVAGALAGAAYAATTLTLAASPSTVVYGKAVALSGALSTKRANQQITVQAQECGKPTFVKAENTKTVANGAYSVAITPAVNTVYQAKWKSTLSPKVTVSVKPQLKLTRVARGSYKAQVTAGLDLKGKTVLFQRYSRLKKRWVQVKKVTLSTSTPGTKPTVVASASFKSKVRRGTRVRVYLSKAQAAPCYVKVASRAVRA